MSESNYMQVRLALRGSSLTTSERALVDAIALRASGTISVCWASQATLAADTALSPRQVRGLLPSLTERGMLVLVDDGRRTETYRVDLDAIVRSAGPVHKGARGGVRKKGGKDCQDVGKDCLPAKTAYVDRQTLPTTPAKTADDPSHDPARDPSSPLPNPSPPGEGLVDLARKYLSANPADHEPALRRATATATACKSWLNRRKLYAHGTTRDDLVEALRLAAESMPPPTEADPEPKREASLPARYLRPEMPADLAERWDHAIGPMLEETYRGIFLGESSLIAPQRLWLPDESHVEFVAKNYLPELRLRLGVDVVLCTGPPETMFADQPSLFHDRPGTP